MKENDVNYEKYQEHYSEDGFWEKVKNFASKAGVKAIYTALKLYYAAKNEHTPAWAKGVILGTLGYFILPIDLIPDIMVGVGFTDDLGVMAAAIAAVATNITSKEKAQAKEQLFRWFGNDVIAELED